MVQGKWNITIKTPMGDKSGVLELLVSGKTLTESDALRLMSQESNLIKRPLLISGRTIIAGFDRDRYRELLK